VILHGSLTLDDYVPGRSDVDLLVVIDDPLSDARLAALTEAMASRRAEAPGPVDLRVITRQVAASPTPAPPMEAYLRLTPGSGVRLEERRHPGERDLAVELSVCRGCWRWCGRGSPRHATTPSWGIPASDADEGAGEGGGFVGGQEHGRGRHLSSRGGRRSSRMASNCSGSPLNAGPLVVLGVL
jgi:hypothetical protein